MLLAVNSTHIDAHSTSDFKGPHERESCLPLVPWKGEADLKLHCTKNHSESKEVAPTFLSRANGFYMARFPRDYKIIISIGSWDSEEAFCARRLLTKWCKSQQNTDMVMLHWKAGWAEAMEEGPSRQKRTIEDANTSDLGEDPNIELEFPSTSLQNRRIVIPK